MFLRQASSLCISLQKKCGTPFFCKADVSKGKNARIFALVKTPTLAYVFALVTVVVWGETFVSTKVLITHGLAPVEILIYRFAIAYAGIWSLGRQAMFAASWRDEMLCVLLGLGGGSFYFIFENTALQITQATDVSLLVSTSPIQTAFALRLFYRSARLGKQLILGSVVAMLGVALVIFNGSFVLDLHPLGYLLSFLAATAWAFYGVAMRQLSARYSSLFLSRKVFFYGILTALPFVYADGTVFHFASLGTPVVIGNLLFLGVVASLLCYLMWNSAIGKLGVVRVTNFVYFIPIVTLLFSAWILHERITGMALFGAILIIFGVYWAERKARQAT
jgi:drug/metabolite transporter (DMT)-like permease